MVTRESMCTLVDIHTHDSLIQWLADIDIIRSSMPWPELSSFIPEHRGNSGNACVFIGSTATNINLTKTIATGWINAGSEEKYLRRLSNQ